MTTLYTHKDTNIRKTWLLITMSLVLVIFLGWVLSLYFNSQAILYFAVGFSIIMNVVAYWYSDKIALATTGASPIKPEENPYLYKIIENLTITAGLPMPRVYIIHSNQINAFATGRDPQHAAIAVTEGALSKLQNEELEGVIAHEMSHIGNRDILVSTVIIVIAGVISILSDIFLRATFWGGHGRDNDRGGNALIAALALIAAILAPIAAMLIQLAVSRKREFLADVSGALLTRFPDGLANALEKISHDESPMPRAKNSVAHLFISNPFKGKQGHSWFTKLFMTHPPLEERIKILRGMKI